MTERELRTVAEAIADKDIVKGCERLRDKMMPRYEELAQAAISASDSRYVKGLVEALKEMKELNTGGHGQSWIYYNKIIDNALQNYRGIE